MSQVKLTKRSKSDEAPPDNWRYILFVFVPMKRIFQKDIDGA